MSEEQTNTNTQAADLGAIFAFKVGMTSYLDEKGEMQAATLLRCDPLLVSQIKTKETDGYTAVQVSFAPRRASRTSEAQKGHLKSTGFENGAKFSREIRVEKIPDGLTVGTKLSVETFKIGDFVRLTSKSKGKGFEGVVKRFGHAGGPATHGSGFHRVPGSSGNRTWPARVMPGKKFPGHLGAENTTLPRIRVLDVIADENVIIVRGPVPGAANTVVQLMKV
jgi:large subunit ribosomal protein L3